MTAMTMIMNDTATTTSTPVVVADDREPTKTTTVSVTTADDGEMIVHNCSSKFQSESDLTALTDVATESSCSSISTVRPETESPYTSVTFGDVEVREYERLPGDHPDVLVGLPITIGWAFKKKPSCPIETYESKRQHERKTNKRRRRTNSSPRSSSSSSPSSSSSSSSSEHSPNSVSIDDGSSPRMERLGSQARKKILEEFCTLEEIRKAEKSYSKYRKQREKELEAKALLKLKKKNGEVVNEEEESNDGRDSHTKTSNNKKKLSLKIFSSKIKKVFSSSSK